jgi:hypothetical protein
MDHTLDIALKEWAIVVELLVSGRCCLLLRKGGIAEWDGPGRFRLDHERFALFPAWEHENLDWIKPAYRLRETPADKQPATLPILGWAEVAGIWQVPSREVFDTLDDLHPWTAEQVDMRFNYKPDRPLYAMVLRAYRFNEPKIIPNRESFAGCRSWVPLPPALETEDAVHTHNSALAMLRDELDSVIKRVASTLSV